MKNIKIVEVKNEIGAGTRGASLGVDAIKIAALDFRSNYFIKYPSVEVETENGMLYESFGSPYARRISGVVKMYEKVCNTVKETLQNKEFPIVLSGDHSTAGGTISGIKAAFPDKRIGVIWIDAHADLHSPYTSPSGNMHGMPLAAMLNDDNKESQVNNPDKKTVEDWEKLKNTGVNGPKIRPEDLVFIALRDYEPQEGHIIKKNKIKVITTAEIRKKGIDKICRNTLESLSNCDLIYISFDVDSMDSSISKGTGTPVANGINEREAANIILCLTLNEKVCCFEITEVNPTLDKENLMAENTFEILQKVTNQLALS